MRKNKKYIYKNKNKKDNKEVQFMQTNGKRKSKDSTQEKNKKREE